MTRFPTAPLQEAIEAPTTSKLARALGYSGNTAKVVVDVGFTEWQADKAAVRCGLHPAEVWPDWFCSPR